MGKAQREYYWRNRDEILAKRRKYRQKYKEKIKARGKAYRHKNRAKLSLKGREYYQKHREKEIKQTKRWQKENRQRYLETMAKYRRKQKEKLRELLGDKCVVCGSTKRLIFHEIHGKPHNPNRNYIIKHYKDFVVLCFWCHRAIHLLRFPEKIDKEKLLLLLRF